MDTPVQESAQAARSAARRSLVPADGQVDHDGHIKLTDQFVLSTAALATEGIDVARTAVTGAVQAVDAIVMASLDTAESFVKSSPIEPVAAPPLGGARQVWSTSASTLNEVLAQV